MLPDSLSQLHDIFMTARLLERLQRVRVLPCRTSKVLTSSAIT